MNMPQGYENFLWFDEIDYGEGPTLAKQAAAHLREMAEALDWAIRNIPAGTYSGTEAQMKRALDHFLGWK